MTEGKPTAAEANLAVFPKIVGAAYTDSNNGRERCCQRCAGKSHLQRKHKDIIKQNIEAAACEGCDHRN